MRVEFLDNYIYISIVDAAGVAVSSAQLVNKRIQCAKKRLLYFRLGDARNDPSLTADTLKYGAEGTTVNLSHELNKSLI